MEPWNLRIFRTRTGSPEFTLPMSAASWRTHIGSRGAASHVTRLRGLGIPKSFIREVSRGNKYTVAHCWGDFPVYAGPIQNRRYSERNESLQLSSKELRGALLGKRLLHGVNEYDPVNGAIVATSRSHEGAARIAISAATKANLIAGWELPIDWPAMTAGTFNATWRNEDGITLDNAFSQIEKDGGEVALSQYITSSGYLRWNAIVGSPIAVGTPFLLPARAPGTIVIDPDTDEDYADQLTGLLGFGKGWGPDRYWTYAPRTGDGIGDLPVMDTRSNFDRIDDQTRLEKATDVEFGAHRQPVEQRDFSLYIGGRGPAFTSPGRLLDYQVYGSLFDTDGSHTLRVNSLSGGLGLTVKPEVQAHG